MGELGERGTERARGVGVGDSSQQHLEETPVQRSPTGFSEDPLGLCRAPPQRYTDTSALLRDLARAVDRGVVDGASCDSKRLVNLTSALEARTYELRPDDVLRAIRVIVAAAAALEDKRAASAMLASAHMVAATVASRIFDASPKFCADALTTLAETKTARRQDIDCLLSRLVALSFADLREFKPRLITRITNALGNMKQQCKLCARDGSSPEISAQNRRCVGILCSLVQQLLPDFDEDDLALLHEGFAVAYIDHEGLGRILIRATHLGVGLRLDSREHLDAMRRLVAAVSARYPELIPTLPETAIRYCMQLQYC